MYPTLHMIFQLNILFHEIFFPIDLKFLVFLYLFLDCFWRNFRDHQSKKKSLRTPKTNENGASSSFDCQKTWKFLAPKKIANILGCRSKVLHSIRCQCNCNCWWNFISIVGSIHCKWTILRKVWFFFFFSHLIEKKFVWIQNFNGKTDPKVPNSFIFNTFFDFSLEMVFFSDRTTQFFFRIFWL